MRSSGGSRISSSSDNSIHSTRERIDFYEAVMLKLREFCGSREGGNSAQGESSRIPSLLGCKIRTTVIQVVI